jgi:hypothetical protein
MRHSYIIATALTMAACGGKSPYYPEIIPPHPWQEAGVAEASTSDDASDMDVVAVEVSDASTQPDVGAQEEASSTDDASDAEVVQDATSDVMSTASQDAETVDASYYFGGSGPCVHGFIQCGENLHSNDAPITVCCYAVNTRCVRTDDNKFGVECVPVDDHPTPTETGCHR